MKIEEILKGAPEKRLPNWQWEEIRARIIARDGNRCTQPISGKGVEGGEAPSVQQEAKEGSQETRRCEKTECLEVDHILPVALGGKTVDANLTTLCSFHHRQKTKRDVVKIARVKSVKRMMRRRELLGRGDA